MDPANIGPSDLQAASSQWAQRTEAYEAMVQSGDLSPTGAIEAAVSAAGRVQSVEGAVPEITALMGTHLKQRLAYFEPPPEWGAVRRFTRLTAAALGTYEMRDEVKAKLRHHLGQLSESASRVEEPRVLAIEGGIDETIATDRMVDEVIGRQGEFLSAG